MSVLRGWVWVWASWAYFHTLLFCNALAEPKAAVFGGVPIIDEKGKRKYYSQTLVVVYPRLCPEPFGVAATLMAIIMLGDAIY